MHDAPLSGRAEGGLERIPEISVVIPCRNEEANAEAIAQAVIAVLEPLVADFEIIFIDNGSQDRTAAILRDLCGREPRVRLIINTRNFGQMRSPTYGIFAARGRAVIGMCADFQDPPALLPEFVARWRAGAAIVLGVREAERGPPLLAAVRALAYRTQRAIADHPIVPGATGFGLYDRRVVAAIAALNEPEPFFRALLVETGHDLETIGYARPARAGGRSNNHLFALLDFALNGLAASSKRLLRAPLYLAFAIAVLTLCSLGGAVWAGLTGHSVQLWLLAAVLEGQSALLFLFLGLIGVQVQLVSDRTRNQPLVIERERVNFPPVP